MKKILIAILSVFLLASCGNNEKKDKKTEPIQEENIVVEEDTFVKTLDYKKFIKNVWDIETYPDSVVYKGKQPCVIDFYADWCGPCKAIAPTLEEIAKEYAGELYIYKINVDNDPEIANAFNIVGIPTLLFIPMEGRYTVKTGAMPKEELVEIIKENCFK